MSDRPTDLIPSAQLVASYISQMAATSEVLAASNDLTTVLNAIAERAREVTRADYAAISVFGNDGRVERFHYAGIDEDLARRMGDPPRGRGLLGELSNHIVPMRLEDLREHATFTGWPEGHPPMQRFLGIPVRASGRTIGSLYMTRLDGAEPFTETDELRAAMLSLQVAASVSHALANERQGRLSLFEERERIAHDLHDGTIQSLYALGLECDVLASRGDAPPELRAELENAIDRINHIIGDIRQYISALEARTPSSRPELSSDLPFVVRQLVPEGVDTIVNISASALKDMSGRQAEDILYIVREAVSNAVRHGEPTKIAVDLRQDSSGTLLTIQDNGKGFDPSTGRKGLGTITMRTRADRLGAELIILGIPGMGTTIRVAVPRSLE